jgi:hypothetical protein
MQYKGLEYRIVQTANPSGWKWTIFLDATRTRTGTSHTKANAVLEVEIAIDRAIKRHQITKKQPSGTT